MAHRRISSAEKGKGLDMGTQLPPRSARVKVPLPDNSELLRKHTLTLIGRVTNKTVQKVWSVIPFFTEHWKTEFKPVGSDLGNGLFQFQFELESDLLSVLEQRPYHYARWMIILQRWEPTISPSFPSLIPFWVKVQGLPVHLWTEATIKCIGEDIGLYEKAEITTQTARMRVHIDGLLPLIKESVVEFPNGDEVATTLVYERLDKHCTKCLRLDHELKECLVARAEAKAKIAREEETKGRAEGTSGGMAASGRTITSATANQHKSLPEKDQRNSAAFQFSAAYNGEENLRRNDREQRVSSHQRPYKSQTRQWQERSSFRRSSQARERTRYADDRSSRPSREYSHQRHIPAPPSRSYYREISRKVPEARETGSSASKNTQETNVRGTPRAIEANIIPQEAISEAMGELRNVMLQYTKCADPTEREARKERVRQAEEKGEMEESAIQMARAALNATAERYQEPNDVLTPERIPVTQRLGPSPIQLSNLGVKNLENSKNNSQDRLPATLRLGSSVPLQANNQSFVNSDREEPTANDPIPARTPAAQRITLPSEPQGEKDGADEAKSAKKKRGRPPGKRTISGSPKLMQGEGSRRRTVAQNKPSPNRRKPTTGQRAHTGTKGKSGLPRSKHQADTSTTSSENRPICNMIPATTRKRMDFRIPSTLGP